MERILVRQLVKTAFIAAPAMSLMLATPVFILAGYQYVSFWLLWLLATLAVLVNWFLNLGLIIRVASPWTFTWKRIFVCSLIVFSVSQIGIHLIGIHFQTLDQ